MKVKSQNTPGNTVDKILPVNGGDTGLIPGVGRFHIPWSNGACVPQLLNPCAVTVEAQRPESPLSTTEEASTIRSLCTTTRESACAATKTQSSQNQKKKEITIVSDEKNT